MPDSNGMVELRNEDDGLLLISPTEVAALDHYKARSIHVYLKSGIVFQISDAMSIGAVREAIFG